MTDTSNAAVPPPEFDLPQDEPENWEAIEIVYTFYTRNSVGDVVAQPRSYVVCKKTIQEFIRDVRLGAPLPPSCYTRTKHPHDPAPVEQPIDIYVGCKSYVVIELDRQFDWRFKKGRPGVTTKVDYGDSNWGLRHVMPGGAEFDNVGPSADDCRIVYFGMRERDDYQRQHFRLHVVSGKGREDPVLIDPDIPNDGGRFPAIDRSPCRGTQPGAPHCT